MSIAFADPLNQRNVTERGPKARRILVVDDEEMVRVFASMALEEEGYIVLQAGDASEAAYIWSREDGAIDLLLADISLPGQSGVELAENLRNLNPDLHVLFASGYEETAIAAGDVNTGYLPKPYTVKSLLEAVRRHLPANRSAGL